MNHGPQDWKSAAANQLHRMGLDDSARALYGIKKRQTPVDERQAYEWREEAERRARRNRRPASFLAWLRTLLWR